MNSNLIRFDWAMKRLLRDKSNYVVLEGFLSTLLEEDVRICKFLESEANQSDVVDKFNRADMLVENTKGELMIIEIQNNRELDYFHRMLYGVSKTITEYIGLGDAYSKVRKVYSINIVYSDLGQGLRVSRAYLFPGIAPAGRCFATVRSSAGAVRGQRGGRPVPGILRASCQRIR